MLITEKCKIKKLIYPQKSWVAKRIYLKQEKQIAAAEKI
jgi:hypothetical protein